jgi:hypothetical protein
LENSKGKDHSGNLGVDGRLILECILGKEGGKMWSGFIWLRIRTSGGGLVNMVMNLVTTHYTRKTDV